MYLGATATYTSVPALILIVSSALSCTPATRDPQAPAPPPLVGTHARGPEPSDAHEHDAGPLVGIDPQIRYALRHNPSLQAAYEEWRAATEEEGAVGVLPGPTFSYSYFIQSVETRVGPQRHKLGVSQDFPWPRKLTGMTDAAGLRSQGAKKRYEAEALNLMSRVAEAHWQAWVVTRLKKVEKEREALLTQLSSVTQARVEVGQASLADLAQINVALSRTVDRHAALEEQRIVALADLRSILGAPAEQELVMEESEPALLVLVENPEGLLADAEKHPRVIALAFQAQSQEALAESEDADLYPDFRAGVEYIETGPALMPVPDDGKDPIIATISVKVPVWAYFYRSRGDSERAMSRATRARQRALALKARAATERALSGFRDSARQVNLYSKTLLPQAEAMYGSVLGSYQAGKTGVAAVLLANQELLDLQAQLYQSRAAHARSFARLEALVGRRVKVRRSQ